jgi:hypothetical protein
MPHDLLIHFTKNTLFNALFKNTDEDLLNPRFNDMWFVLQEWSKKSRFIMEDTDDKWILIEVFQG